MDWIGKVLLLFITKLLINNIIYIHYRPFRKWQDGKRVKYKKWQPGEPNNHGTGESCTEQYRSQRWNDLPCRTGRFFVCNYKGIDNRRRRRGRRGRRSRRRSRRRCTKGSRAQRRRCRQRRRRYRRRRRERWKCSRLKFDDYERKECLRRRRGMIRRFGRRRARRRWNRKLSRWMGRMQGRGYGRFSGLRGQGRGFRKGFAMGQRSMKAAMGMGRMRPYPGMKRGYPPPRGQGYYKGGLGAISPSPGLKPLSPGQIPVPPRIQLIDLPSTHPMRTGSRSANGVRRLHTGQLGTGLNIGMTGHHHKYGMSTYALQNDVLNGATRNDVNQAAKLTSLGMKQLQNNEKKKQELAKEMLGGGKKKKGKNNGDGFNGFNGFDGFGSGYYHTKQEKEALRRGNRKGRFDPAAVTFGLENNRRRRLIYDIDDIDIYDYDDMENQKKCILFKNKSAYEICVGYDFVDIKQFIKREINILTKDKNDDEKGLMLNNFDTEHDDFINYIGYEHTKYKSMMKNNNYIYDNDYTHFINVYEFIYDIDDNNEKCFNYLEPFTICLNINDKNEMIVIIENEDSDFEHNFNFSNNADWNEIDEIKIDKTNKNLVEKCVRLFETKICMHCENDSQWKLLLYKTA